MLNLPESNSKNPNALNWDQNCKPSNLLQLFESVIQKNQLVHVASVGILCEGEFKTAQVEEQETCRIKEQEEESSAADDSFIYH